MSDTKVKKISTDLLYSFLSVALLQASLQFLIYPIINKTYGSEVFGNVLYVYSFVAIFAVAVGGSVNNLRMVNKKDSSNGDFLFTLFVLAMPCIIIFLKLVTSHLNGVFAVLGATLILILSILRYYSSVDFWLKFQFKQYFWYYCIIVGGYLVGSIIVRLGFSWLWIFIIGEAACIIYIIKRGNIYASPFKTSENRNRILKGSLILLLSNLLYNFIVNLDRTLLLHLLDANMVTVYYVASLIGRMFALVVGPLNGILITYLGRNNIRITRKKFVLLCASILGLSSIFFVGTIVVTPLFISMMYPNVYNAAMDIYMLTNLSQIICFAGSMVLIIVLTLTSERYQIIVQSICAFVFVVLAIILTGNIGIKGFVYAGLIANGLRLILAFCIGAIAPARKIVM